MSIKRRLANLFLIGCGLRKLHHTRLQRFIQAVVDEVDLQHFRDTHPCPGFAERRLMYDHINASVIQNGAIEYLEFGVYRGDSIRHWAAINQNKESRFHGFDSFEGLPEDWRKTQGKGHFNVGGAIPDIPDGRIRFIKGWFDKTVPEFAASFAPKQRLVLHLDADLYSSTMIPLVALHQWAAPGTLLIFDEFYDRRHEFKAFQDYQRIWKRAFRVVCQMDNFGRVCVELL